MTRCKWCIVKYDLRSQGVRFSDEQPERTSAGDALAAVTATMQAADRVMKDKSISSSVALNLRDLTMDRYQKHMEGNALLLCKDILAGMYSIVRGN